MSLYPLLHPSVGLQLIGASPISKFTLPGNHIYHGNSLVAVDLYHNGSAYIVRGGTGAFDGTAPTEIYQVTSNGISLSQILYSQGSNKVLVGDFLNNGTSSIFNVGFTDNYPNTVLGSYFTQGPNGTFQTKEWLDFQAHGPSIGQFNPNGITYVVTPAQWPNAEIGLWISHYSVSEQKVINTNVSWLAGPSSAIIPATETSKAYIFIGQTQNGGQDAIIPIALSGETPILDASRPIQYFSGFWTSMKPENMAVAYSYPTTQEYLTTHPLRNNENYNHSTEAQVADLNGDGLPDVLVTNLLQDPISFQFALSIYQQQKNGTFIDVTLDSFIDFQFNESGPYHFFINDVNHDGHLDIVFGEINWNLSGSTTLGSSGIYALANSGLYINDGVGHFVRASTDQTLFSEFKNSQIAVIPLGNGNIDIALFDPNGHDSTGQLMTVSLYQGIANFSGPNGINPAIRGAPGFNEWYYLNSYSDAASAVGSGAYATGLDYYLAVGKARGDTVCAPGTIIYGSLGSDHATFVNGAEVFCYQGNSNQYTITPGIGGSTVFNNASHESAHTFHGIQRLQFSDTMVALDNSATQTAGKAYLLYQAAFNRVASQDPIGLGYWIDRLDHGANIVTDVSQAFINSPEFTARYGANPTNASFVDNLYQNVLHRGGEAGGVTYWNGQLNNNIFTKAEVLNYFAVSAENVAAVGPDIANGIAYTQWVG